MSISARNQLKGKVTEVILGDVMAHVTIRVGQNLIDSVITRKSADELKLKKGDNVIAVVKATEVMVSKNSSK
jgi:molybdopterin-binding protein